MGMHFAGEKNCRYRASCMERQMGLGVFWMACILMLFTAMARGALFKMQMPVLGGTLLEC